MVKQIHKCFSNYLKNKKGITLPMMAIGSVVIIGATLMTLDQSEMTGINAGLQDAADRATSSSAHLPVDQRVTKCKKIFDNAVATNPKLKDKVTITSRVCTAIDGSTGSKEGVEINVNAKIMTSMRSSVAGITGKLPSDKVIHSVALFKDDLVKEVVFSMAIQGTMCAENLSTASADSSDSKLVLKEDINCSKFNLAKQGIIDAVDTLHTALGNKLRVGLVPFTYKVKFPNINQIPPSVSANEPANFYVNVDDDGFVPPIIPLTANIATFKTRVQDIEISFDDSAWGRLDLGLHVGALALYPDSSIKPFFSNHDVKGWNNAKKYLIVLSDGSNIGCCYTNQPQGNFNNQYIYVYKPYVDHALEVCKTLKKRGVTIYTVMVNVPEGSIGYEDMNNVMARCASGEYADASIDTDTNQTAKLLCSKKSGCFDTTTENITETLESIQNDVLSTKFDQ